LNFFFRALVASIRINLQSQKLFPAYISHQKNLIHTHLNTLVDYFLYTQEFFNKKLAK